MRRNLRVLPVRLVAHFARPQPGLTAPSRELRDAGGNRQAVGSIHAELPYPPTATPLFEGYPYGVIWNMPTPVCKQNNIPLDTSPFQAVTTPEAVPDQFLFLFYTDRLGLYPFVDYATNKEINGGIPQKGNLTASLDIAQLDVAHYMPSETSTGLAVIDWEAWRPLWDGNLHSKTIYRTLSIDYARQLDPSLSPSQAEPVAKEQFQTAARNFMEDTMSLGISMRPSYLWGFYLFPKCYNDMWEEAEYTGMCPTWAQAENDQLLWLWQTSTALYPSVYLATSLANTHKAALYVRNQVHEAMRVASQPKHPFNVPIYVYTRPVFTDQTNKFLSVEDLVHTLGENAAVGASGSVLWGGTTDFEDKASCEALSSYLTSTLNLYITNVTAASRLCSESLCQGNGRCIRKDYNSDVYLHLNPASFSVQKSNGKYVAVGIPTLSDLTYFSDHFTCQCYAGLSCSPRIASELPNTPVTIPV
ncbi:hyaluronidase-5-like isoform X2 [Brienomyrus brachyistius]|uniref:hyaluronidase-5-like isoform X2 n=1 Tax=Brienomyrus brachyistius TaxID=42636 RepID=UPI0020B31B27|nr:hyaluronidase-5-like isoform X2 [Brienomyrus brachyistius]